MAQLSKENIEFIKRELAFPWGIVRLACDSHEVTVRVRRLKGLRFCLVVYVDGWVKGEWLSKDCEERRRFYRPSQGYLYSAKERERFIKAVGKRYAKGTNIEAKFTNYYAHWLSVASMLKHFHANNKDVRLLGSDTVSLLEAVNG